MRGIRAARSRSSPSLHASARIVESRMCSRLFSGSASTPSRAEQARGGRGDALAQDLLVLARRGLGRRERLQDRDRQPRGRARRVDREVGGVPQAPDARAVLAPLGQALLPHLGLLRREVVRREALARRASSSLIQGRKSSGARSGNVEQQVAEVALRIDDDRRDAVDGGLLEQRQAEPGLAAARHADADGVRDEIARVVEQQVVPALLFREVERLAEVERAELLEVLHLRNHID